MGNGTGENQESLFRMIFGREENHALAQDLLHALGGASLAGASLEDVLAGDDYLYLRGSDGTSILIAEPMRLYDEAAAFIPNTPVLMIEYLDSMYARMMENKKMGDDLLFSFPLPKLMGFYHGTKEEPDERILHLQDAFEEGEEADISIKVRMLNLHDGKNTKLMDACKPLSEYVWFVKEVRERRKTSMKEKKELDRVALEGVIDRVIDRMQDDFQIKDFMLSHREEVKAALCAKQEEETTGRLSASYQG